MARAVAVLVFLAFLGACDRQNPGAPGEGAAPAAAARVGPKARVEELVKSNAKLVGYLFSPEQPAIIASFSDGELQWRSDPQSKSSVQGRADVFTWPDKSCVGFEQKNLFMPTHGPERYLVCEAVEPIQHRNNLPRSQDFNLARGDLFFEYQPPARTGFPQVYYLSRQK
jgi:hypothetical protein